MSKKNSNYQFLSFVNRENITKINNFIKNNLWLTPLIYIVGTLALLIRNEKFGLQFAPISLLRFALILIYLIIFLGLYYLIVITITGFIDLLKNKSEHKILFAIIYIIMYIVFIFISLNILLMIVENEASTLKIFTSLFILWPIINVLMLKHNILTDIMTIICFTVIILEVPMSIGGLKGQEVVYYNFDTKEKNKYIYYGNYEGLYQFVSDNKVILLPIDSGYIEYNNK